MFFKNAGIQYSYEHEGFKLEGRWYLPDFWLPEIRFWFEVKGDEPRDEEQSLCEVLASQSSYDVLLAVGAPEPREQLIWLQSRKPDEEYTSLTRRSRLLP